MIVLRLPEKSFIIISGIVRKLCELQNSLNLPVEPVLYLLLFLYDDKQFNLVLAEATIKAKGLTVFVFISFKRLNLARPVDMLR